MLEVLVLGIPQDLHALVRKQVYVPCKRQARPVEVALGHVAPTGIDVVYGLNSEVDGAVELLHHKLHRDELLLEGLRLMWHGSKRIDWKTRGVERVNVQLCEQLYRLWACQRRVTGIVVLAAFLRAPQPYPESSGRSPRW